MSLESGIGLQTPSSMVSTTHRPHFSAPGWSQNMIEGGPRFTSGAAAAVEVKRAKIPRRKDLECMAVV